MNLYPLKLHLETPIDDESRDTELHSLLEEAKEDLIVSLGYKFDLIADSVTERHDVAKYLYPNIRPIVSVASVCHNDYPLTEGTDYIVEDRFVRIADVYAEEIDINDHIDIVYRGGIAETAKEYKPYMEIMVLLVEHRLNRKKETTVRSQQYGKETLLDDINQKIQRLQDKVF